MNYAKICLSLKTSFNYIGKIRQFHLEAVFRQVGRPMQRLGSVFLKQV